MRAGDRIELVYTNDQFTELRPGAQGVILDIKEALGEELVDIRWDSGSRLSMIPESGDTIRLVTEREEDEIAAKEAMVENPPREGDRYAH